MEIQTASDLPLKCGKCGRSDGVEINSEEIHCSSCGNYAFVGRPARWPFVKPELKNIEISKSVNPANNISGNSSSPLQVAENIADKKHNCEMLERPKQAAYVINQVQTAAEKAA